MSKDLAGKLGLRDFIQSRHRTRRTGSGAFGLKQVSLLDPLQAKLED